MNYDLPFDIRPGHNYIRAVVHVALLLAALAVASAGAVSSCRAIQTEEAHTGQKGPR